MRKRTIIILSFLILLYIVPLILVPSSGHAAILAEPNMTRDFSTSAYGDISPQSITSFSETLADDVLFRLDNESYGDHSESFVAVADWVYHSDGNLDPGQYGFGSDGDVGDLWADFQDADNEWVMYETVLSTAINIESYIEYRFKSETSNVMMYVQIEDTLAATYFVIAGDVSTSWYTDKLYLGACGLDDIKKIRLRTDDVTSAITGNLSISWDYFRISPADETGWQHDGSTNASITPTAGDTVSSNGDIVTLDTDVTAGSFEFVIDTTATAAAISCTYYPFLSMNITSLSVGDGWRLWQYDGSAWVAVSNDEGFGWTSTTGMHKYNIRSLDSYVYKFRFNMTATALLGIDFIKAYSIANFTYTGSGVSLDDYLYVSAGTLYCSGTSFTSIVLDHDPTLSVNTILFQQWNVTTGLGTPQFDHYISAWIGYSSATQGNMIAGTLTDVRIKFTASANVAAIEFIDIHDWQLIVTVIILFTIPYDETALNWLIIFLGLFMIPASTLYLVKGGRDNLSMNKVFFFIVAFMLGWGLVIGGIFG